MKILEMLRPLIPTAVALFFVAVLLLFARRLMERRTQSGAGTRFQAQMVLLGLGIVGFVVVVLSLPVDVATRGNLLSFFGLLVSAALALSSTTVLGNLLAGFMLRGMRKHRSGDFLRVEGHFGRVTRRGLLSTEIQTEESTLTTLPNLYLVRNPFTVIRSEGTIVSADLSLGYDVARERVKELLTQAAADAELQEPFVRIRELGNFSVGYRISGLLKEVKQLLSVESMLRGKVLDALHEAGIEIISPNFMTTRALAEGTKVLPAAAPGPETGDEKESGIEEVAFDKADEAEVLEALKERLEHAKEQRQELDERIKAADKEERDSLEQTRFDLDQRIERQQKLITAREARL